MRPREQIFDDAEKLCVWLESVGFTPLTVCYDDMCRVYLEGALGIGQPAGPYFEFSQNFVAFYCTERWSVLGRLQAGDAPCP